MHRNLLRTFGLASVVPALAVGASLVTSAADTVLPVATHGAAASGPVVAPRDGGAHPPAGTTLAGTSGLDRDLAAALTRASAAARADGVVLVVNSGWRSAAHQQELLDEAVEEYGSLEEASRWVATPETSAHVSGDAVDLGPKEATAWLARHGAAYGLCPVYRNEPWHYELRPSAADAGCPAMYDDPTDDPRMQQ